MKNSNSDTEEPEEEEVKEVEGEEGDATDVIKKVEADVKAVENGDYDVSTFVAECFYTQVVFAPSGGGGGGGGGEGGGQVGQDEQVRGGFSVGGAGAGVS